jgi:hypothetical protein
VISIPEVVERHVNGSPYLREAMTDKLINLSALARQLQPKIEKELMKPVSESAVFIALQRFAAAQKPYYQVNPSDYLANLSLRSDLFEMTIQNSPQLMKLLANFADERSDPLRSVFIFTSGPLETTIITSEQLKPDLMLAMQDQNVTGQIPALVGITLQRTHGQVETTGVLQFPLRILAWEGISVIEIFTTLNEIMIVVREFEVDRAVVAIRQALAALKSQPAP